jgi:quercetin dioxygenase-like cupin family protein
MTDTYLLLGNLLTFRARNSQTGALSLVEARTAPGAGAPPNRHPGDDEAFYVLSGKYEFVLPGTSKICGAGECVVIPNGAIHSFRNIGDEIARVLILNWPGKQHEMFFSAVGDPLPPGTVEFPSPTNPVDIARVIEIGLDCGIEFPEAGA